MAKFSDPLTITFSVRLYQKLLLFYPQAFRREYGWLMAQVFGDSARRVVHEQGTGALLPLWVRTLLDTVSTAIEEHLQRGVDMSKSKFITISGWAAVIGGVSMLLGWLTGLRPEYNQYQYGSYAIDRVANAVSYPLVIIGILLVSIFMVGLILQYGQKSGGFGRISLGMGAVSGLVSVIGASGIVGEDLSWAVFMYGLVFQYIGFTLWGVVCLQKHILSRWNGLPLVSCSWFPILILGSWIIDAAGGNSWDMPDYVFGSVLLITAIGLAVMGLEMRAETAFQGKALQTT